MSGARVVGATRSACLALVLGAVTLPLHGCAMFVSKDEYRDYRAVRVAPDDRSRLLALEHYASKHKGGHWYGEIDRERLARDVEVFEAGKSSRDGLSLYLAAFPDGAFVKQAQARLSAIEVIEARKQQEQDAHARFLEQRKARDEELRRTWVARFSDFWVKTLAQLAGLGQGIERVAEQNPDFSRAFGRAPRPRCTSDDCVKLYESAYAVPVPGGTRIERAMRLVLRLQLKEGKLVAAELLFPSFGFSRWREQEERRVVIDADLEDRTAAVKWAFERMHAVIAKLGVTATPQASYALAPIAALRNEMADELTDTTAVDPSAPPERVAGAAPDATIQQLVDPTQPPAADMELAPMRIDKKGRAQTVPAEEMQLAPMVVPPATGQEMVLEPMQVGAAGGTAAGQTAAPATGPAPAAFAIAPARVEALRIGGLRVVIFSAAADDPGSGFDGVRVELP